MGIWLHMATAFVPIYGLRERRSTLLDNRNGQECPPPGKEIWRQRTERVPRKGDYSLPSRTVIINVADIHIADAQRRTAIAWSSKWPPRSSVAAPMNSR